MLYFLDFHIKKNIRDFSIESLVSFYYFILLLYVSLHINYVSLPHIFTYVHIYYVSLPVIFKWLCIIIILYFLSTVLIHWNLLIM